MIEIIQKKDEGKAETQERKISSLPKNFRQIGSPNGVKRIYMEDFVYTYLHSEYRKLQERRVCILTGRTEKTEDSFCLYINGAFEFKDLDYRDFVPVFNEASREEICLLMKQHFPESDLLGWFYDQKGVSPKLTPELEKLHKKFFGGNNRVLFLSDSLEKEETIYLYEDQVTHRQNGYYIYYERNERMQEYMITSREDTPEEIKPEEVRDEALKNYREMFLNKPDKQPDSKNALLYATGMLVVLVLCITGISLFNNYSKMKNIEDTVAAMSGFLSGEKEAVEDTEYQVVIEEVAGNVEPQETESDTEEQTEQMISADAEEPQQETAETWTQPEAVTQENETLQQGFYIVQPGDSMTSICQKIYQDAGRIEELCELNGIDEADKIYAGEKLILPQ
ncbi:MAG: LysM peptidoglycan-binding domain-containing protein [Lachnospiraceae bacterium]|nr:LysM peptidoglycan-binding domain-containing protein [Lachnospiraceae bacterium]